MLSQKFIKSFSKKNKDFKLIEDHQWDLEFEPDVRFMYFTYRDLDVHLNHIILLATNLDKEVHYEFITQEKHRSEDTKNIISELEQELLKELSINPDFAHKEVKNGMDKEKYIKIIEQDEQTQKRMQRYINKKKKEEELENEKEENTEKKE